MEREGTNRINWTCSDWCGGVNLEISRDQTLIYRRHGGGEERRPARAEPIRVG
jgi:hypothetical protein